MIREAIVLAGGLGTRLREAVPDLPKTLAPVAGRPFLGHVIDALRMQGIQRFVFALGYKSELILDYLKADYKTLDYTYVVEEEPLGTGGAIRYALTAATTANVLVVNGDTLFRVDVERLALLHDGRDADCTLALKPMKEFERYGVVRINDEGRITAFEEKKWYGEGLINGGVYLIRRERFLALPFPPKFSFEKDYLEARFEDGAFYGSVQEGYFIDIGIPEDFSRAQDELKLKPLDLHHIDKSWTLFLDRDGVINDEIQGDYVLHWKGFVFSTGVLESFRKLSEAFGRIIIISNQRGVGKGLMTEADLQSIHHEMKREVEIVGGKIDALYYCTEKEDTCFNRKPNPGMALQAMRDFSDIDPSRSLMVGNKITDMQFGRAAGFYTVFVKTTNPEQPIPHPAIDLAFENLAGFANAITLR